VEEAFCELRLYFSEVHFELRKVASC